MPDWTYGQLKQEFLDHGHQYLLADSGDRAGWFIQRGVEQLCDEADWPFQERSESNVPGVVIEGLGRPLQVYGADGVPLKPRRRDQLRDVVQFTDSGAPRYYYR